MSGPQRICKKAQELEQMRACWLPNQLLFSEGEMSREMYILMSGKVEILKNDRRIAVVEGEGSYLGELSTLLGVPRTATARTMSQCEFIVVDGEKVSDFFQCSPVLSLKLARILADRLVKMNVEHMKLEQKIDMLTLKLRESSQKLEKRDRQIQQLISRIEQIGGLR